MADESKIKHRIELEGEKEYNKALAEARRNLKTLKSELKAETAELGANATAQQKNEVKVKSLQKQIKEQEKVVKTYREALEEVREKYGDNEEAIAKWEQKLNDARTSLANMKNQLDQTGGSFSSIEDGAKRSTVETYALAESFGKISDAASSMSGMLESVFSGVIGTIRETIGAVWGELMDIAAKADAWEDLGSFLGASATDVQKWDRAMKAAHGDLSSITNMVTKLKYGGKADKVTEWFGISGENYTNDLEYAQAVLQRMSEMKDDMVKNGTWSKAMGDIFGAKKVQEVDSILSDWPEILRNLKEFDVNNGGIGLSEDELTTMNELYSTVGLLQEKWNAFKESVSTKIFGKLALDITSNAQGALDALIEFMDADTQEERDAAMKKFEENLTEAFTRIGEALRAAAESLGSIGDELQGSENSYVRLLGKVLSGLSEAMEWITGEGNLDKVLNFFRALFDLWIGTKAISAIANIAQLVTNFTNLKNLGWGTGLFGGNNGNTPTTTPTTGGTGGGGWLTGIMNSLNGILPGISSWVSVNGGPVWDWLTHESPFAGLLTGQETLGDFWERQKDKFSEENVQAFKDNWDPNNPEANVIAKLFGDRSQNADAASRLESGANWAPSYMGGYGPGGSNKDLTEVVEDVLLDTLYTDLDRENAVQDWWDAWRTNADDEESAFEWMKEVFGDDFGDVWDQIVTKMDELADKVDNEDLLSMEDLPSDWWTNQSTLTSEDISGFKSVPGLMKAAVQAGVSGIKVTMDGRTVGNLVAPYVSQYIARETA